MPWDVVTPLPAGASLLVPREIRYHALQVAFIGYNGAAWGSIRHRATKM
ncbi:hypothetical protein GME_11287 [Halomonas sp. TD01]|nr:hypothetical protein GME_11287 [Halomonas sp. TD01]